MAKSGHGSSRPPPASRSAPVSSRLSPVAAIQAEAQKAAKELQVDDFVDTYLRERPKTRNPYEPLRVAPPAAPAPPIATPAASASRSADEESGIRPAIAHARHEVRRPTVEVEAVAVAGADGEVVALEAELAEREERIESLEQELKRLRDSVTDEAERAASKAHEAERASSKAEPPVPVASEATALPASPPVAAELPATDEVRRPSASAASPVTAPIAPPAPGRSRIRPILGIALLAGAAISLVVGVGRLATDDSPGIAPTADPTPAAPRAAAEEPATPSPPARAEAPSEAGSAAPMKEPTAPSSIPTTDTAEAPPPAADTAAEPEDAPGLLSFQGHLTVSSSVDAEVVVQGQPAGRTNQRLLTRCGPRNVRLRNGTTWITEGEHVRIVCMKHTSIRLDPSGSRP